MEMIHNNISWSTFFWANLIVLGVWLFTTKTQIGRNIIKRELRWSISKWSKLLIVIALTLFILVNPIYHLIDVAVVSLLYYLIVYDGNIGSDLIKRSESKGNAGLKLGATSGGTGTISLVCKGMELKNRVIERSMLDRCLFSFPYMKDKPYPSIHYLDGRYHITLGLSSDAYLSSLVEYLTSAGFETQLKKQA